MYIKQTFYGYGVFRKGFMLAEFATYDEAWNYIHNEED